MAAAVSNSACRGDSAQGIVAANRAPGHSPHRLRTADRQFPGSPSFGAAQRQGVGYQSTEYALSLAEFGVPRHLRGSGGWLLERDLPGDPGRNVAGRDAMGCYPLFACTDWNGLAADLAELQGRFVSVALVADPFGDRDPQMLEGCFDFAHPFKEHFVVDLERDPEPLFSRNHRYKARRSLRNARVELCADPAAHLDEWMSFYDTLIARHRLRGLKAFSRASFARQLHVPGLVMFRYVAGGLASGAQLWFIHGETAYNHLVATSAAGYATRVAYGLCYEALRHFRSGLSGPVRRVDLGGGAGIGTAGDDGLTQFKRGWATGTQSVFFCGRVFDRDRYDALTRLRGVESTGYFPAYRQGEFG